MANSRVTLPRTTLIAVGILLACVLLAGPARAATFTVNSTLEGSDFAPGDNACDSDIRTPGPQCTLRAAVQETNGLNDVAPSHTINLPAGTYTLSSGALTVTWNLELVGAGARTTIIEQSGGDRVLRLQDDTNISGVTIRNGTADRSNGFFGGNVLAEGSNVTISSSTITGGSASSGGGLSNQGGTMVLQSSTVSGNAADTGGGDGGAIQNGNTAAAANLPAILEVRNSTISDNAARLAGGIISGGHSGNAITISDSTIASNNSGDRGGAGGILVGTGFASFENSIVALNGSGASEPMTPNCSGAIRSLGFNLESATDCAFTGPGDRQSTDPRIGALQNAGGPTDTRPLLAGSPAIDAGNAKTCLATDQRGVARRGVCDIGAFEFVPATPVAPETVIVSGPAQITRDRTPTFTFTSNVPGTAFECSIDGGAFSPCASPLVLPALGPGRHSFRVRAVGAGGADSSPAELIFAIPAVIADLPAPRLGRTVNAEPVSGSVFVAVPGASSGARRGAARASQKGLRYIPLREARQIPIGSYFNTRKGKVRLQSASGRRGRRQAGVFSGGLFKTLQSGKRRARGLFELRLKGSSFKRCRRARKAAGKRVAASRRSRRRIRRLRGSAKGRFRTRGRYSAATVRGTIWTVTDRCDGTLTKVSRGRVAVRDFRRHKNILVRRGKSYLAKAR